MMRLVIAMAVAIAPLSPAQSIVTVAGGGDLDGRPATLSQLSYPQSVALDHDGDLYIADGFHCRIRRISARTGLISTIAGNGSNGLSGDGGPATKASIAKYIEAMAVDAAGNVYFTDTSHIRKVSTDGIIDTVYGGADGFGGDGGPAKNALLSAPSGLAFDSDGNLYIADLGNHRVRRIAAGSGVITTIAGNGIDKFAGDGGPATLASLNRPMAVAFDPGGSLYISDSWNNRIRRIDRAGTITTIAGTGIDESTGDGGPARNAGLHSLRNITADRIGNLFVCEYGTDPGGDRIRRIDAVSGIISAFAGNGDQQYSGDGGRAIDGGLDAFGVTTDAAGNLYVADANNDRVRRVDVVSGIITTIAGNGLTAFGDGGPATAASLLRPHGMACDSSGNLYIADTNDLRVRKLDVSTGVITTVAGTGLIGAASGRGPAISTPLWFPRSVSIDAAGDLHISEAGASVLKVSAATGLISIEASKGPSPEYSGDGGSAIEAGIDPQTVAVNSTGDLFISDVLNGRIRKVRAADGVISTYAGNGDTTISSGDGGPATAASLLPFDAQLDAAGNLYVADDAEASRIRRIDAITGVISTVAGGGIITSDGVAGTSTFLDVSESIALDRAANLYIADLLDHRVRKLSSGTGLISTVAGNRSNGFSGDGGPATAAGIAEPQGVAVDSAGNLYISAGDRVRAVYACVDVHSPALQQPSNGSESVPASPKLSWSRVKGAFHYDVLLDTVDPPVNVVATDITAATYSPSNLQPLTKYYWRIVAKGDPFCTPFSSAPSEVSSFTTTSACASAAAAGSAGAAVAGTTVQLSWTASARAAAYDLSLGATNPPRVYAKGITGTTLTVDGLASGTTYFWSVTAHASCDPAQTATTSVQSFATAGACAQPQPVTLLAPADNDNTVAATVNVSWSPSPGASAYDLYLGNGSSPPLYMSDLAATNVTLPRLSTGTGYTWRVVARAACNASFSAESPIRHFTVAACGAPQAVEITSAPRSGVAAGATYAIGWSGAVGLDGSGSYLVERASDAQFANVIDRQETTATSASFTSPATGTYYHRVTAIAACDRSRRSPASAPAAVSVVAGAPVVIFTMQPQAVITKLGDRLEDQKTTFALENLGSAPVQVLVAPQLIGGSVPFFTIVDPFGGDSAAITLAPHEAHTFELHFSGPPNDVPASYQGSIYVTSLAQPLAFTPQAYVNLKVGGDAAAAAPKLLVNGVESGLAFFPPVSGDDSARPVITVDLLNSGATPMEVAGEIGPEAWLKMEKDWNGSAVPPSSFRPLRLSTQRTRALAGSALPRYTYLTVRNKSGQSARLLVEDAGGFSGAAGRRPPLAAGETSWIVPSVRSGSGGTSILHLTNTGSFAAPVELIWTPEGADGFDDNTKRITLAIPPNDVVTLTDPLAQLFGATGDASGSIELRSAAERLGALVIRSEVHKDASGGAYGYAVPLALRGEGARVGAAERVAGLVSNSVLKTSIVVCETSGRDAAAVQLTLRDASGAARGQQTFTLPRYGSKRIDDLGSDGGSVDVDVTSGGGTAFAFITVSDRATGAGASIAVQPAVPAASLSSLGRRVATNATSSRKWTVGSVENDAATTTAAGFVANAAATVKLTYRDDATGQPYTQNFTAASGQTRDFADVVQSLTNSAAPSRGVLVIESDGDLVPYARVRSANAVDALPVVSQYSESLTGGGSSTPAYAEGLEQSLDATRGRRTSLVLTEVGGRDASVTLRLYEPGDRSTPIAAKNVTVPANGELRFDDLFASMGLLTTSDDLQQRRKDRVNVACVVTASGGGTVQAVAIVTDNRTGDRRTIQLQPAGGAPATVPQRGAVSEPARRRAAGR